MQNSMEVPQKNKKRIAIWSTNPTSGHISRQNSIPRRYIYLYVHSNTIHCNQDLETIQISINRQMDKEDVVHKETQLSYKKEWNNAICSNMDEARDYHTKWSKKKRKTNTVWYHLNEESRIWHKPIYETETNLAVAKGEAVGGGTKWKVGVSRCNLLYMWQINNKVLLNSIENYIQYLMINYNGKIIYQNEYAYAYTCIYLNHFAI